MLEHALSYAARGWPVFPLWPKTKKPLTRRGVLDATTSPDQIRAWWSRWPDANIAIATGAPGPDVLDIDDMDAADASLLLRLAQFGPPSVQTHRGMHLYFRGSDARSLARLGYGELRRGGYYVLAPPSVHPNGTPYAWIEPRLHQILPELPDGLIEPVVSSAGSGVADVVDHVPPGEMYDYLLDLSIRLVRAGVLDESTITRVLLAEFAAKRMSGRDYGGDERDTRRIAAWAARSAIAQNVREATTIGAPPTGVGSDGGQPPPAENPSADGGWGSIPAKRKHR